ncbi:MAG: hypothetical protein U0930_25830 [Pirellulales bacterium]
MQFQQMPGDEDEYGAQRWNSYTYLWNEHQTDAELVEADGRDIELHVRIKHNPVAIANRFGIYPVAPNVLCAIRWEPNMFSARQRCR